MQPPLATTRRSPISWRSAPTPSSRTTTYSSDLAWVDLDNPRFDVIFAPYETYLDDLLGVKTSYGAAVMIRNAGESAKLSIYKQYAAAIQDALPLAAADRPSNAGHPTPMEVMDTPYRSGDLRHGYQAVADNLPNDPRIHAEKGTKKIFFKNFMDARVKYVVLPVGKLLMRPDQARLASMEGYLAVVVMHEMSHGLGPAYSRVNGKQEDIRASIGSTSVCGTLELDPEHRRSMGEWGEAPVKYRGEASSYPGQAWASDPPIVNSGPASQRPPPFGISHPQGGHF